MGTSRCSTVATLTSGARGGPAADVLAVQAVVASNAMTSAGATHMAIRRFNRISICLFLLFSRLLLCAETLRPAASRNARTSSALEVLEKVPGIHSSGHELGALFLECSE